MTPLKMQPQDNGPGLGNRPSRTPSQKGTARSTGSQALGRALSWDPEVSQHPHFALPTTLAFSGEGFSLCGEGQLQSEPTPESKTQPSLLFKQLLPCPRAPPVFTGQKKNQTNILGKEFGPGWGRGPGAFGLPESLGLGSGHRAGGARLPNVRRVCVRTFGRK